MRAFRKEIKQLRETSKVAYDRHHRIPRCVSNSSDEEWNISIVKRKRHKAWNTLFSQLSPHQIAEEISRVWIDPHLKFICVPVNTQIVIVSK